MVAGGGGAPSWCKFRSNSDLCLTGYLRQILPGVIAYGIQFDPNLCPSGQAARSFWFKFGAPRAGIMSQMITPGGCLTA